MYKKILAVRNGQHVGGVLSKIGKLQCGELAKGISIDVRGISVIISSGDSQSLATAKILADVIGIGATICDPLLANAEMKIPPNSLTRVLESYESEVDTLIIVSHEGYTSQVPQHIFKKYGIKDEVGIINEGEAGMFNFVGGYSIKIKPVLGMSTVLI